MFRNALLTASLSAVMALSTVTGLNARAFSERTGLLAPQISRSSVEARSADRYEVFFRGGETGRVEVNGDGTTMLDLCIYDENGNFIMHQSGYKPWVTFEPRWTQRMTIRVENLGTVQNDYVLRTN